MRSAKSCGASEHLAHRAARRAEGVGPGRHQSVLADGGDGLEHREVGGALGPATDGRPAGSDRSRADDDDLASLVELGDDLLRQSTEEATSGPPSGPVTDEEPILTTRRAARRSSLPLRLTAPARQLIGVEALRGLIAPPGELELADDNEVALADPCPAQHAVHAELLQPANRLVERAVVLEVVEADRPLGRLADHHEGAVVGPLDVDQLLGRAGGS